LFARWGHLRGAGAAEEYRRNGCHYGKPEGPWPPHTHEKLLSQKGHLVPYLRDREDSVPGIAQALYHVGGLLDTNPGKTVMKFDQQLGWFSRRCQQTIEHFVLCALDVHLHEINLIVAEFLANVSR
jgi:hypothetical protein